MTPRADTPLTLASASPRRRRLLAMLEVPYACTVTDTAEEIDGPLAADPPALVAALAAEKAVAARAAGTTGAILALDTVVVDGDRVLGKPTDLDEARAMLAALSGRTHRVATGVALLAPDATAPETFSVVTPVRMRELAAETVEAWLAKGEVLGCAGAYNIESHLAEVDADQCYQNVAGIPLCHVFLALCRSRDALGLPRPTAPVTACDAARHARCQLGPRLVAGASCP